MTKLKPEKMGNLEIMAKRFTYNRITWKKIWGQQQQQQEQ